MADDWDADDFEPPPPVIQKETEKSQWEDEDKEEEPPVKASWEEEDKPKPAPKPKKAAKKGAEEVKSEVLADPVAEKLRQQRLVEESDFKATKELFGGKEGERSLDDFIPKTEAEFEEYAALVAAKVTPFAKSFHYMTLLKVLVRKATESLPSDEVKKLNMTVSAIANEKLKQEKEAAGKKKAGAKKQQLKVDKAEDDDYSRGGYSGGGIDDDYDFM